MARKCHIADTSDFKVYRFTPTMLAFITAAQQAIDGTTAIPACRIYRLSIVTTQRFQHIATQGNKIINGHTVGPIIQAVPRGQLRAGHFVQKKMGGQVHGESINRACPPCIIGLKAFQTNRLGDRSAGFSDVRKPEYPAGRSQKNRPTWSVPYPLSFARRAEH